jgi:hypothetical protein
MTTLEMIRNFRINYDIINLGGPGYEDEEVVILLNQAQSIEILKEVAIKRWTYITQLIVNEEGALAAKATYSNYVKTYTPVQAYIAYVSSMTNIIKAVIQPTYQWVENILISKENAGKFITSTINLPILLKPRVFEDNEEGATSISVVYDVYTTVDPGATGFKLAYIRKPADIAVGVTLDVNPILHDRIITTAVDLAKKVINPNEAATSVQTNQLMNRQQQ